MVFFVAVVVVFPPHLPLQLDSELTFLNTTLHPDKRKHFGGHFPKMT